jgi:MFS family permease
MAGILGAVGSLVSGISLIQLANGYVGTLIGIRLAAAHVDPVVIGIVTSAYFAGYAAGAVLCNRLINPAGHIRAFTACAGLVTAALLGHPLYFDPILWVVLRAFVGLGCAGPFVATESWLNASASTTTRGTVFAIYMPAQPAGRDLAPMSPTASIFRVRDSVSDCGRHCCKSILPALARNIDSRRRTVAQLRFVASAILILSLRYKCLRERLVWDH